MSARDELAARAARAGYGQATLALIAQATIEGYAFGERLSDEQIGAVAAAVEVCACARASPRALTLLMSAQRLRSEERWRERFWAQLLRAAAERGTHD